MVNLSTVALVAAGLATASAANTKMVSPRARAPAPKSAVKGSIRLQSQVVEERVTDHDIKFNVSENLVGSFIKKCTWVALYRAGIRHGRFPRLAA